MRGAYCYLPILSARGGAFRAVSRLSPLTRSRLTPQRFGSRAIPVAGTEADRGQEYLNTIRGLMARSTEGVCLRFARDELIETNLLRSSIESLLKYLEISPTMVDVVLDFCYVGRDRVESLRATTLEALQAIHGIGPFRNVTVAGSSMPDVLNKRDQGKVRREARVELDLWSKVVATVGDSITIALGDYGVVGAHHAPPGKPVSVPSRSRYTTLNDHVFRRAKPNEYPEICRQLVDTKDFLGPNFSVGDQNMKNSAMGLTGPGNPAIWVASDTNHHLELVSAQAWSVLQQHGLDDRFALAVPKAHPWLQPELLDV